MQRMLTRLAFSFLYLAIALPASARPPNVVIILADDLGYADLGCYGGEIETPNLDRLAQEGFRFTQFYNTARCWPTRAALLTGYYAQQVHRDALPGRGGGGQGKRPSWAHLLPEYLRHAGYRSYHSGKWHLDGNVLAGGFDRSYHLSDQNRFFNPQKHLEDDRPLPAVSRDSGFYGTVAIGDYALRCLREHQSQHPDQPFFAYVAFTAPHFPLQAPEDLIDKYVARYAIGWDKVRQARWQRQQDLGLHLQPLAPLEPDIGPPYAFPDAIVQLGPGEVNRELPWDQLTDAQRTFQTRKMAIHAAMIDALDQQVGRVLEQLQAMNAENDTVVMFLSDNGASAEIMVRGDGHDPNALPGSADTYLCLGPGWSRAANTPFRRHKTWVHEGGISTPLIVRWPAGMGAAEPASRLRHQPAHVIDVVPTVLELAGLRPSAIQATDAPAFPGHSLRDVLLRDIPLPRDSIWWLHEGNRALRVGDWKIVATKQGAWELYDLAADRAETKNLAAEEPAKTVEMERIWESLVKQFGLSAPP